MLGHLLSKWLCGRALHCSTRMAILACIAYKAGGILMGWRNVQFAPLNSDAIMESLFPSSTVSNIFSQSTANLMRLIALCFFRMLCTRIGFPERLSPWNLTSAKSWATVLSMWIMWLEALMQDKSYGAIACASFYSRSPYVLSQLHDLNLLPGF